MKSFIYTIPVLSLVFGSAFAAPTPAPAAVIALSNDASGAYGGASISLDGSLVPISNAFQTTGIAQGGAYTADSASLAGGFSYNPVCTVYSAPGVVLGQIDTTAHSYIKFTSQSLSQGLISCTGTA